MDHTEQGRKILAAFIAIILSAFAFASAPGCVGEQSRQTVGVPALVLAHEGVAKDAQAGIATLPANEQAGAVATLAAFTAAIQSKDTAVIRTDAVVRWPHVKAWAEAGITDRKTRGLIGPGVAESLRERVKQFDLTLAKVARPGM